VTSGIAARRLRNQRITRVHRCEAADTVAWFGAMQSQEYAAAQWAIALRMSGTTRDEEIERAFDEGKILRTHVLRPTWHFVTPADIRWMVALTAPHVQRRAASYYRRNGLDHPTLTRATKTIERALADGQFLSRADLAECLRQKARLELSFLQMMLLMMYTELESVTCSGPRRRKHHTYALLSERVAAAPPLPRDEALAELTRRYFASHGPATIRDFVWWSGLSTADTKRGLEINRCRSEAIDGITYWSCGPKAAAPLAANATHLLPIYDEYLVAYRDRAAVPHHTSATLTSASGRAVVFQHALVIGGQIAGTWRTVRQRHATAVEVFTLRRLSEPERRAVAEAAERYGRFLDCPVSVSIR
jgi:Winged helix DNA-binding domain